MSTGGSGYVWLKLQDNDRYETTATRLYGPQASCQRPDACRANTVTSTT